MIRATVVLLVAHLVIPRLRRRSAAERHLLWAAALVMAAVLPAWTAVMPAWAPDWARHVVDTWPSVMRAPWPVSPDVVVRATAVDAGVWTVERVALTIWVLGVAVALIALARDAARLVPLVRHAAPSTDEELRSVVQDVATRLGVARLPTVLVSTRTLTPMTWGVRRPQVLLPSCAVEWPRERLTAVLAHEFAHVVRGDWVVHILAQIVCAIYWFHPLFWLAERTLGRESEQAADDQALRAGVDARDYASHLVAIVRAARAASSIGSAAVAMARVAHLERRISALLRTGANRERVTRRAVVRVAVASGVLAMPLGAMSVDRTFDVDVRAASLPVALATASDGGWEPMLPFVRRPPTPEAAVGAGDMTSSPAIAEYTTPPLYSDEARRRGIEGIVTIGVHVDERGGLSGARVMNGLGAGLDQNALVAVRQWRFRPGTRAGVPVPSDAEVEIEFNLRSEAVNELIANDMATLVGPDVTPPRVVQTSPLPLRAGRARGSVVLDVVLLQNGSPKIVRILRSLSPQADEIAVRHFEQWRFTPAMKRGVPVKVRMNAEVRFHG